jgi:excisionase family DNA binding protein
MQQSAVVESPELVTVSTAARLLGVSEGTVRSLANRGALRCRWILGQRVFDVADIERVRAERQRAVA